MKPRRAWRPWELVAVAELYPEWSTAKLAALLGRSVSTVYNMAAEQGLHKSAAYLASPAACRLRRGDNVGKDTRFKKGQVPLNKGKRMPGWAPGRMAETQFKKGQRSGIAAQRWMPIGSTRLIEGYLYRKVADIKNVPYTRNWKLEHVLVWEKEHRRSVPPGHAVVFKDGNKARIEIANLELVSRAELMRRNTVHNLPKELVQVIQLRGVLNRRIRSISRAEKHD